MENVSHRIEVTAKAGVRDPVASGVFESARADLGLESLTEVRMADAYSIASSKGELTDAQLDSVATQLLCDPVVQAYSVDEPVLEPGAVKAEVRFLPGVTDNAGAAAAEGVCDVLGQPAGSVAVRSSRVYSFAGIGEEGVRLVCSELLANGLIQEFEIYR